MKRRDFVTLLGAVPTWPVALVVGRALCVVDRSITSTLLPFKEILTGLKDNFG
jgi:hypothetical protein